MTVQRMFLLAVLCALFVSGAHAAQDPALPQTIRKIVLEEQGDGYRWKLTQVPMPAVGEQQVLIRVRAVSLNRGDLDMLRGEKGRNLTGFAAGTDAAGDIVAVGRRVTSVRKGARVTSTYFKNWDAGPASAEIIAKSHGQSIDGVAGEYIVLDETAIVPMAAWMSYEQAATLPTAGLTAWNALVSNRKVRRHDVVLVQGTGGVSSFAIQFARSFGARIIVTSSSDEKLLEVKALGAEQGVNYRTSPQWAKRVKELTNGHGADFIVNVAGKDTLAESTASLAYGGELALVGGISGYDGKVAAWDLLSKTAVARGIYVGSRADYRVMLDFMTKHRIEPVIDRVFPFEQYAEALQHLGSGDVVGKVVLRI